MTTPYIEASVVQSTEDKMKILTVLEKRTTNFHNVEILWMGTDDNPILRVIFPSEQALIEGYARDQSVYEGIVYLANEGVITPKKISQVFRKDSNSEDLYLILKYTTNFKDPLRNNYQFTYKIADMLGISMTYEETKDGFILFYKHKVDFEIGLIDLARLDKVKEMLEKRGHWDPNYVDLWKTAMKKK
jgi:hypothetical protein